MKKSKILLPVFMGLVALVIVTSCNKDELKNEAKETTSTRTVLDAPTKNVDVLKFRDFNHFSNYTTELNSILSQSEEDFESSIYQPSAFQSVYWKLVNDEFVNPNNRYKPFLTDPVIMAIVNENFELIVGDVLITYVNNTQVLRTLATNTSTRNAIRNMTKGTELTLGSIPTGAAWGEDRDKQTFIGPWCGCEISIKRIDCATINISGNCQDFAFGSGDGTVNVYLTTSLDFPTAGSVSPISTTRVNGNFSFNMQLSNTSPIFVHASAKPDCFFNNVAKASSNGSYGTVCDPDDKDTGWLWTQNAAGTEGMNHRTSAYQNLLSGYERAELFSMRWNGFKWVKNNAKLSVTINATRKTLECGVTGSEYETKTCNSCSNKSASVNTGLSGSLVFHHCDGDVLGTFRKVIGATTISATGSPNFECCN